MTTTSPDPSVATSPPSEPARRRAAPPARWWSRVRANPVQAVLLTLPVLAVEAGAWAHRWVTEDAFIYLRVVDNLFAGNGPVFNPAERVEAGTGTVWTFLLAAGRLLTGWALPVEWFAVLLGLVCTAVAVLAVQFGAVHLERARGRTGLAWPAGIIVFVALPPVWDFATSGLETSLELAWIAVVFAALARRARLAPHERPRPQSPRWLPVVIGLGPLVRPDLAILTVAFGIALWLVSTPGWRDRLRSMAWAAAVPVAWEVFRIGFFGVVVPNTAIAKSAGSSNWPQGVAYLTDFARPYLLVVPAVLLAALVAARWLPASGSGSPAATVAGRRAVVACTLAGAGASALYVTRLGGDFMHARFLLPALFAALAPVSAVCLPSTATRRALTATVIGALAVWGVAASRVTVPYAGGLGPDGIADERRFWEAQAGRPNPVTLADYESSFLVGDARKELAEARAVGPDALVIDNGTVHDAVAATPGTGAHLAYRNIGVYGVEAGLGTWIVDPHGLADPLAARLQLPAEERHRPGHEKNIPAVWLRARFAAPRADDPADLRAARRALTCGDPAEVLAATNEPLGAGRVWKNITGAVRRTRVALPADPFEAERRYCGTP